MPPTNTYFSFHLDKSWRLMLYNYMIPKLSDSQSFSKVLKAAVWQKFCAILLKIRSLTSADCLGNTLCLLIQWISLQTLRKNYIVYLVLWLKTCNNVKLVTVWNACLHLASPSIKNTDPNNSMIFNRCVEVITFQKLEHVLHSDKREAFQKVK